MRTDGVDTAVVLGLDLLIVPENIADAVREKISEETERSGDEITTKKGPVFATAIIAGVMAAKKTHELIPFCHPLGLEKCKITIRVEGRQAIVDCRCKVHHKTGVEMEALTGASVAGPRAPVRPSRPPHRPRRPRH